MRVLIVGGVFARDEEYRRSIACRAVRSTPIVFTRHGEQRTLSAKQAREVKQEYAVETMIDRHLELYESLLQGRNSTAKRPARATGG